MDDRGDLELAGIALGVRLAAALYRFWWLRGYPSDGRRVMARVVAASTSGPGLTGLSLRPLALSNTFLLAFPGGARTAVALSTDYLAHCREIGDDRGVIMALSSLGLNLAHLYEDERGAELCEEGVAIARKLGEPFILARALQASALVAQIRKEYEQGIAIAEEAISIYRPLGSAAMIASALRCQSICSMGLGNHVAAKRLAEDAFRISHDLGDRRGLAMAYKDLGRCATLAGELDRAVELLHLAIAPVLQMEDRWLGVICISVLAAVKVAQGTQPPSHETTGPPSTDDLYGHLVDGARLFAAAEVSREPDGLHVPSDVAGTYDRDLALLQECLGGAAFSQAWREGRAMSWEHAVEYAFTITAPGAPTSPEIADGSAAESSVPGPIPDGDRDVERLTAREREVARLIVAGRTNREIAEALILSERTVDSHVRNIMAKLEVGARAQIAAWAVQHGLGSAR